MSHPKKEVRTLNERLKVIEEVERNPNEKKVDVAKRLGLPPSTLNSIIAKKTEIRDQATKFGTSAKKRKTGRESTFAELEEVLYKWYLQTRASNIPIDGSILKEKAKQIALRLSVDNFSASNGWAARFKQRHGLVYKKAWGESSSVNEDVTKDWFAKLPEIIKDYDPCDIYNVDETGLFYNSLPDRTLTYKGENCHGGKHSKERLTVLLCSNSDGSDKLQPWVIGKSQKPRCFKNIKKLPVRYHANKNSWMTAELFLSFLRYLDSSMGAKCRKILLFLDNCPAHPPDTSMLRNVKVVFYPPNCTSVCQPLDMGIIKCLKQRYRKFLVQKAVFMMDVKNDGSQVNMKINVLQAVHYIADSWKQISPTTITNCFMKCGVGKDMGGEPVMDVSEEDNSDHFEEDFNKINSQNIRFDAYVECDSDLAVCGVQSLDDMCAEARGEDASSAEESEDADQLASEVPSFSEAYSAFEKVKCFVYSQVLSETEQDTLLKMDSMFVRLNRTTKKRQSTLKEYFKM